MKKILTLALALAATLSANAIMINISNDGTNLTNAVPKADVGGNPEDFFDYLVNPIIPGYTSVTGNNLPAPIASTLVNYGSVSGGSNPSIDLSLFDYAAIHYGGGQGGGVVVYWYLNGMTGLHTFSATGPGLLVPHNNPTKDPVDIGDGGISNIRLWKASSTKVPDTGTTLAFFGLAFAGLIGLRRFRR